MVISTGVKHGKWSCVHTGKGKFIRRLIPALRECGARVVSPTEKADIDLQIGKYVWEPNARKSVIRLGAAHIDKNSDYKALNARKSKALKKADGIVYQSDFSKKMCEKFIGKHDFNTVILNGAPKAKAEPLRTHYKYNFCAVARTWTPQKRLRDLIRAYFEADIDDSCLWIAGETDHVVKGSPKRRNDTNVIFMGGISNSKLLSLYETCDTFIHLTMYDACPNAVAEAVQAGCNIITHDQCGAQELMSSGIVLPLYKPLKAINFKKLHAMDTREISKAIVHSLDVVNSNDGRLDMKNIAEQYLNFFEEVLCR